jgi:RNA polymerase sigma-70 factor (family 1)
VSQRQTNQKILEIQDHFHEAEALKSGSEAVFDRAFRQYYAPLCHYAMRLTNGDRDEAEDLVQQSFVKLWERRQTLDIAWSIRSYLYKMVHHAALNRIRHEQIKQKHQQHSTALETPHIAPEETSSELMEKLQRALAELPPQCRHIFELSRFENLKYREIAEQLQISIKTVETQMGKALRIMRLQLADYLVTIAAAICFSFKISILLAATSLI